MQKENTTISFQIPADLKESFSKKLEESGMSISGILRNFIYDFVKGRIQVTPSSLMIGQDGRRR